jgi:hypothetical protein
MNDMVPAPPAPMPRPLRRILGLALLFAGLAIPGCVALFGGP